VQRVIAWIFIILLSIILQSTVIPYFSLAGIYPDLVLAAVMVLSLWYGRLPGIWAGFLTGLLLDIWAPELLGLRALAMTITGALVGLFESSRVNTGPISQFFLFVLGSSIHDTIVFISTTGTTDALFPFLWGEAAPRAFFTAMFGMALIFLGAQFQPYGRR
jgi:rod shape-determining protein MreD